MAEAAPHPLLRRLRLLAVLLVLGLLAVAGWFVTRRIAPGDFVVRLVPAGMTPGGLRLTLLGPGGGPLGEWRFDGVPGPAVLQGLEKKVPWTAVATNARQRQPCLTLEVAPHVSPAAVAAVEGLVQAQCCPGLTDAAQCPLRRVTLGQ